jgi:hypothetical protein
MSRFWHHVCVPATDPEAAELPQKPTNHGAHEHFASPKHQWPGDCTFSHHPLGRDMLAHENQRRLASRKISKNERSLAVPEQCFPAGKVLSWSLGFIGDCPTFARRANHEVFRSHRRGTQVARRTLRKLCYSAVSSLESSPLKAAISQEADDVQRHGSSQECPTHEYRVIRAA